MVSTSSVVGVMGVGKEEDSKVCPPFFHGLATTFDVRRFLERGHTFLYDLLKSSLFHCTFRYTNYKRGGW